MITCASLKQITIKCTVLLGLVEQFNTTSNWSNRYIITAFIWDRSLCMLWLLYVTRDLVLKTIFMFKFWLSFFLQNNPYPWVWSNLTENMEKILKLPTFQLFAIKTNRKKNIFVVLFNSQPAAELLWRRNRRPDLNLIPSAHCFINLKQ